MKPNEAKKVQVGDILAAPRWGGRVPRIVVREVVVESPRVVRIVAEGGASWRAAMLELPTPEHESLWVAEAVREQKVITDEGAHLHVQTPRGLVPHELCNALVTTQRQHSSEDSLVPWPGLSGNRGVWYRVWDKYNLSDERYVEITVAADITKKALDQAIDDDIHEWMTRYGCQDDWRREFEIVPHPPAAWLLVEITNQRRAALASMARADELEQLLKNIPPREETPG